MIALDSPVPETIPKSLKSYRPTDTPIPPSLPSDDELYYHYVDPLGPPGYFTHPPEDPVFFGKYGSWGAVSWAEVHALVKAYRELQRLGSSARAPALYSAFQKDQTVVIVMEFIHGPTAEQLLDQAEASNDAETLRLVRRLLAGALEDLLRIPIDQNARPAAVDGSEIRHHVFYERIATRHYGNVAQIQDHFNRLRKWQVRPELKNLEAEPRVYCYQDLYGGNFVVNINEQTGRHDVVIVDYGQVSILPISFFIAELLRDRWRLKLKGYMNVPSSEGSEYYDNANALYIVSGLNDRHFSQFQKISGQLKRARRLRAKKGSVDLGLEQDALAVEATGVSATRGSSIEVPFNAANLQHLWRTMRAALDAADEDEPTQEAGETGNASMRAKTKKNERASGRPPRIPRAVTTEYPIHLLRDAVTKGTFTVAGTPPFSHPNLYNLGQSAQVWNSLARAGNVNPERLGVEKALLSSCQRLRTNLEKDDREYGWRFELRVNMALVEHIRAAETSWAQLVQGDGPPRLGYLAGQPHLPGVPAAANIPADRSSFFVVKARAFNEFVWQNLDKHVRLMDCIVALYKQDIRTPQAAASLLTRVKY
ncbi:Protein kinase-like domain protein [Niveomyces insectorum RCEF 264]|uniref:Protein kinase-like domain protein n=1 Tax=Niveomyces insectorum RCEF 264 TaxID=1081102 RepID=A0A167RT37_9HYPO|nr:Protein kinase-like domain protein [Niveomyces insectorum RCEF 264]